MHRRILGTAGLLVGLLMLTQLPLIAAGELPFASYLPLAFKPEPPTAVPTPDIPAATATASSIQTATAYAEATNTPTMTPIRQLMAHPTAKPTNTSVPPMPTRNPWVCAAEYPTVCIPLPPPDLDCGEISYRRFTVLPPDRHRFDADGNGIGCESN